MPARDLWVSPHHAMLLDGVLIEAKHLIHGVSIMPAGQVEEVELETHDVIFPDGALSEGFVDDDSRGMFHNAHEFDELYPDAIRLPARYYAPRLDEGFEVEAVRRRIALRAGLLPASETMRLGELYGAIDIINSGAVAGWA